MVPFVCGLLKVRNEVVREDNLRRCLDNMRQFCDTVIACDDASTDGTDLVLRDYFRRQEWPEDQILTVSPKDQDFRKELRVKAQMLHKIHKLKPVWIWWQDADEVMPDPARLLAFLAETFIREKSEDLEDPHRKIPKRFGAYRFPYVQLWRNGSYARIDDGFDEGAFIKLWRWHIGLEFDIVDRTHHMQFPQNVGEIGEAPDGMHVIHFGNYGKNLQWKAIQYHGGLGGVERHLDFEQATYKKLDHDYCRFPKLREPRDTIPEPFTAREKTLIRSMEGLRGLKEWFTVVIPTYNRVGWIGEALGSLLRQSYQKWIALVLDDGSTDGTPGIMDHWQRRDPRIFYARHDRRGAVAMNEIGMRFACDATEFWTRLGSDDYFEPDKLLNDALALRYGSWCYGPYKVVRRAIDHTGEGSPAWTLDETCNLPEDDRVIVSELLAGRFRVSWANVAARTELLRRVHAQHGSFCDPSLRNMEDFLINARLARLAAPVFRARRFGKILVGFDRTEIDRAIAYKHELAHDAIWRVNPIGASADTSTTNEDQERTLKLIQEDAEP